VANLAVRSSTHCTGVRCPATEFPPRPATEYRAQVPRHDPVYIQLRAGQLLVVRHGRGEQLDAAAARSASTVGSSSQVSSTPQYDQTEPTGGT
jgi:hypothetical protein